jgi:hypothetical protein
VALAYIESLDKGIWNDSEAQGVIERITRELAFIVRRQEPGGGWSPIKEVKPEFTRTYSTVLALWSLIEARRSASMKQIGDSYDQPIINGIQWLLNNHNDKLGWVANPHRQHQIIRCDSLTAQTLFVLSRAHPFSPQLSRDHVYEEAKLRFLKLTDFRERSATADDHLSDADQYLLPTGIMLEGSTFLWYPWALAALAGLSEDETLSDRDREIAAKLRNDLMNHSDELIKYVDSGPAYIVSENLFCVSRSLKR